jgi:hypothetical protein
MKRLTILILTVCLLCTALACAGRSAEPEPAPAVRVPGERDVQLTLPLSHRGDVTEALSGYTAGFAAASGEPLLFTVDSSDERVATGLLAEDGTLYVIAHGAGEAKLTVTAAALSGETGTATVSVKTSDARRTLVLIVLGVLSVAFLILLGKPVKKEPEAPVVTVEPEPESGESETRKE